MKYFGLGDKDGRTLVNHGRRRYTIKVGGMKRVMKAHVVAVRRSGGKSSFFSKEDQSDEQLKYPFELDDVRARAHIDVRAVYFSLSTIFRFKSYHGLTLS